MTPSLPVLVIGATGYVGNRLVPALLRKGYRVRAAARTPSDLRRRPWADHPRVEIAPADVLDPTSLERAARGCGAAYYLVHSMIARKGGFAEADRLGGRHMAAAGAAAGLERIVYLGGLADPQQPRLSKHLASRIEVARILSAGRVPVTDLRAPMILGSGSASFEILRYLVERLPVMTTPRWVRSLNQPIAISNVIAYLVGCLERPETAGRAFDIGGPERLTYQRLLAIYAEEAGLRPRIIVPVPVLTPALSALWIHLISPVPSAIALPLTEGLTSRAVCRDERIRDIVPQRLLTCREAVRRALERMAEGPTADDGSPAGALNRPEWPYCGDAGYAGGTRFATGYEALCSGAPGELWAAVSRLGAEAVPMGRLRGRIGRRRGAPGRIARPGSGAQPSMDPAGGLHLRRLFRVRGPGDELLEATVLPAGDRRCELRLVSTFLPHGLGGIVYWHLASALHRQAVRGLLRAIVLSAGRAVIRGPAPLAAHPDGACVAPAPP